MGALSLSGLLQSPSRSTESDVLSVLQAGKSSVPLRKPQPVTVGGVGHVDINRGSVGELRRLPGIGPVLAERVVRYRGEHGKFGSIRDIQNVKGIGVKRFAQLESYIYIEATPSSLGE
jgi:competence protein ComEA